MDFDPETLLYLEGGRPYDPAAGRYLTAGSMASGTYNIYAFANNTPVDRSVRDVRGAGMQGIVGGRPIGAGTEAFFGSIGGSLSRIGNGVAQPFLNYYDFGRTLIDAGAELVGYHWNHESVSNMGQAAESGTTMLQLEMALLEGLGTNVADTVTLGGYATYQYRNGDINDSEYGDRMIGMGLSLLGGVGTLRAAGLGSVTVGQATQVALRTAQTTARAAGRALSQIELNPAALTQFNNGIPLNLLRWKQTGNPLAKIAEGFGTAAERTAPSSGVAWKNGWRTADGKFASPQGTVRSGASAESAVWDAVEAKPGWQVIRGEVSVRDAAGQLRKYDGAAISPGGRTIGLEVKSGTATRTPAQRSFDQALNASGVNTLPTVGQNAGQQVRRTIVIRRP